jgi:aerobic-type carbon monoxide dehydrogenase small subunit (CoxS/CutS family)
MKLTIALNGEEREFDVPANTTLLSLLRGQANCFSVKHGCETGECGACAVIVDGRIVNACILLAAQADEREVITLEGIPWILATLNAVTPHVERPPTAGADPAIQPNPSEPPTESRSSFQNPAAFSREEHPSAYELLHPVQQAFVDTHAIQCGYCTPGMILSSLALFAEKGFINLPSIKRKTRVRSGRRKSGSKGPLLSEQEIRDALAGNLCRCTGYVKPVDAVLKAAEKLITER